MAAALKKQQENDCETDDFSDDEQHWLCGGLGFGLAAGWATRHRWATHHRHRHPAAMGASAATRSSAVAASLLAAALPLVAERTPLRLCLCLGGCLVAALGGRHVVSTAAAQVEGVQPALSCSRIYDAVVETVGRIAAVLRLAAVTQPARLVAFTGSIDEKSRGVSVRQRLPLKDDGGLQSFIDCERSK